MAPPDYLAGMRKSLVTSSPTVTLMVTRIPSTITEEGMHNVFRDCGTVLNLRLIVNKGGFAGVRGLNYAYVTVASDDEAVKVIEQLNMKPPLNLGVAYKPTEEERIKKREQDLLDRALGIVKKVDSKDTTINLEACGDMIKDTVIQANNQDSTMLTKEDNDSDHAHDIQHVSNEKTFIFNHRLLVTMEKMMLPCLCGKEAVFVCSACATSSYCSQQCQIEHWPGHREACGGGGDSLEEGKGQSEVRKEAKKKRSVQRISSNKENDEDETSTARSTEDSPTQYLSSGLSSSDKSGPDKLAELDTVDRDRSEDMDNTNEALIEHTIPSTLGTVNLECQGMSCTGVTAVKAGELDLFNLQLEDLDKQVAQNGNEADYLNYEQFNRKSTDKQQFRIKSSTDEEKPDESFTNNSRNLDLNKSGTNKSEIAENTSVSPGDKQLVHVQDKLGLSEELPDCLPCVQEAVNEEVKNLQEMSDSSDYESSPFQSIFMFKKNLETVKIEDKKDTKLIVVDDAQVTSNEFLEDVGPSTACRKDLSTSSSSPRLLPEDISLLPLATSEPKVPLANQTLLELPHFLLPSTWTRLAPVDPVRLSSANDHFLIKIFTVEGMQQMVAVKLARVKLVEPWSREIREIMEVVLGEGREGQVELWVKMVGWEGDLQLVDIKDQEDNDIAGLLCDIGVMERIFSGPDGTNMLLGSGVAAKANLSFSGAAPDIDQQSRSEAANKSVNEQFSPVNEQSLCVSQLEQCMLLEGTMVRLRDIGESSQVGLVRCVEEKERAWLEEVMELTDLSISIKTPQLGQLVAMVLQTKAGTRVARAEIVKVNPSSQKALCQCLDYHDHRVEHYDHLYFPPPACLTISPLCVRVEMCGVPMVERKVAKQKLEQIDQDILSQPLTLHVKGEGTLGQKVELMDMEGNSINDLLVTVLGVNTSHVPSSPIMSPDYSILSSYIPLPLGYTVSATVLHVESPSHLFLCPSSNWEELKMYQEYLQHLAITFCDVSTITPVVGQLVMVRSEQDNMWYRGTVIKLYKSKAKVYCPDYGFVEKICFSSIHALNDGTLGQPKYWASLCTLERQGTIPKEMKRITDNLAVTQQVFINVLLVDGVKYTVDIGREN